MTIEIPAMVEGEYCSMCRYENCPPGCDHSCHEKKPACKKGNCARPDGHELNCRPPNRDDILTWKWWAEEEAREVTRKLHEAMGKIACEAIELLEEAGIPVHKGNIKAAVQDLIQERDNLEKKLREIKQVVFSTTIGIK